MVSRPLGTNAYEFVIVSALRKGRETVYAPGPLRFVMAGLKSLPRPVFRRLPI